MAPSSSVFPFSVLALAPFTPNPSGAADAVPRTVDGDSLDRVLEEFRISFGISPPRGQHVREDLDVRLVSRKDFHMDRIAPKIPGFRRRGETGGAPAPAGPDAKDGPSSSPIDDLLRRVALPGPESPTGAGSSETRGTGVESDVGAVLQAVLSDRTFQAVESAWAGLHLLLRQGSPERRPEVRIVPVSPETLEETLDALLPLVAEDLPSLVLIDLPCESTPRGLELLEKTARFGETLMVPVVAWAPATFFHLGHWEDLERLPFLPHHLENPAFAKFRKLGKSPASRWVALCCNRFLHRYPYGPKNRVEALPFEERGRPLASPVWAAGAVVCRCWSETGWPTRFTEWGRFQIGGLPLLPGEGGRLFPTETNFSEDRMRQFVKAGFVPLGSMPGRDSIFFPWETTLGCSPLRYQLFLSRIAHFLLRLRDETGRGTDAGLLEGTIRNAFGILWETTGHPAPANLDVAVRRAGPGGTTIVRVAVEPSREILPPGGRVELEIPF